MPEFSENIPFITQWKLVRSAIEHENTLKSHRVTWFLATQLFLFTGFTSIFVESVKNDHLPRSLRVYAVLLVIFLLGIYTCILAWANLRAAEKMIDRLKNWWLINCHGSRCDLPSLILFAKYGEGQSDFPPINGMFTSRLHLIFAETGLPFSLAIFWIILFAVTTIIVMNKRFGVFPPASVHALILAGTVIFRRWNKIVKAWLAAPASRSVDELERLAKKCGFTEVTKDQVENILKHDPSHPGSDNPVNN